VITFDPVTPAPLATRIARVVLPLLTCFGYLAFRAYPAAAGRIPLGEAVVMGLVIMGLAMVACIALGDLIYPLTSRARQRPGSEELEITAVHARIADADTVVAQACAAETARLDALIGFDAPRGLFRGTLLQPNVERMARDLGYGPHDVAQVVELMAEGVQRSAYNAQVRRALFEDTQPYDLLTHEFQPQHHTPPGGFEHIDAALFEQNVDPDGLPYATNGVPAGGFTMVVDDPSDTLVPDWPNQIRLARPDLLPPEVYIPPAGRHHRDED